MKPHEAKVTASVLNVREKPSMSAKIIDTVKKAGIVLVMGRIIDNAGSLIDHGGKIGYLFSKYTHDETTLRGWLELAGTRGADEVAAAIRAFRPS